MIEEYDFECAELRVPMKHLSRHAAKQISESEVQGRGQGLGM